MGKTLYETKYDEFLTEIRGWDWKEIKEAALQNVEDDGDGSLVGREFLGTVMALAPSGKYYTPWASNVTEEEYEVDTAWYDALECVAEAHGMTIANGDGDPCDIFADIYVGESAAK